MGQARAIIFGLSGLVLGCSDPQSGPDASGSSGMPTSTQTSADPSSGSASTTTGTTTTTGSSSSPDSGSTDPATTDNGSTTMDTEAPIDRFPGGLVVDAAWLQEHLGNPNLQVIDTRPSPGGDHIPGALQLEPTQIATTRDGITAQVMEPAQAAPVLGAAGLRNGSTVVVYGAPPEYDPARVTWALHHYGHHDVRYLDGGWAAWQAAGGETEAGPVDAAPTDYEIATPAEDLRVTADFVLDALGRSPYDAPSVGLVDARSPREWEAGRIPSATHVQWTRTLDDDGRLLPEDELQELYGEVSPTDTIVTYCLVGWRASVVWLTLRHLGFEDVRVYDGSWVEWGGGDFPTTP